MAPSIVHFLDKYWRETEMNTDSRLMALVSDITQVPSTLFAVPRKRLLREYSIGQKMSWAASRHTTRMENTGYCLLGMFEVNMPLLDDEGQRAFQRLQEEIIRRSADRTIFGWTEAIGDESSYRRMFARGPTNSPSAAQ